MVSFWRGVLLNDWTDPEPDPCAEWQGFSGKDDEQEDLVMEGLRDDVARGLDEGWSQGSRTVALDTALVCSTPE